MDSYENIGGYNMVKEEQLEYYLKSNVELTKQLKKYNNYLAGTQFLMIFTAIILIVIMIRIMGWI